MPGTPGNRGTPAAIATHGGDAAEGTPPAPNGTASAPPLLTFDVCLEPADYSAASRLNLRVYYGPRRLAAFFFGIWLLYAVVSLAPAPVWSLPRLLGTLALTLVVTLAVMAGVALALWLTMPMRCRRLFRLHKMLHQPQTVSLSDDGLHFVSSLGDTSFAPSMLLRWAADTHTLLLYPGETLFFVLPRRCLTDEAWRRLLAYLAASGCPRAGPRRPTAETA